MALLEKRLDCTIDKVQTAIDRLKNFEPEEGYWLAYSGGKDSGVIKRLAEMAGVKFEAHYSCTSVDPPELVRFIKSQKDVYFDIPRYPDGKPITMWNLIPKKKMPPTRLMRYCCKELKESRGDGRLIITGVRWAESVNRSKNQGLVNLFASQKKDRLILNLDNAESRRMVENCYRTRITLINPIIDWTDSDVWEFHKVEKVPYCELYGTITKKFTCTGKKRLGCIGCPMNVNAAQELEQYPKHKAAYIRAFDKMLLQRDKETTWTCGEEVFDWWVNRGNKYSDPNQMGFELEE
jgi:phosphoadenosine phosphosulfate reductase